MDALRCAPCCVVPDGVGLGVKKPRPEKLRAPRLRPDGLRCGEPATDELRVLDGEGEGEGEGEARVPNRLRRDEEVAPAREAGVERVKKRGWKSVGTISRSARVLPLCGPLSK